MSKRIAFVAKMKSGKSTAASFLVEEAGFVRIPFAYELKATGVHILNRMLKRHGIDRRLTLAEVEANKSVFRPFWQWLGTDFARNYLERPTYWVDLWLDEVAAAGDQPILVDDLRNFNEVDIVRDHGFVLVGIHRDEEERQKAIIESIIEDKGVGYDEACRIAAAYQAHESETMIDHLPVDLVIENNTSLERLRQSVLALC